MKEPEKLNPDMESAQRRTVVEITARSFYGEMLKYGFREADIISFTSEILDLLIRNGADEIPRRPSEPKPYAVEYRLDSKGEVAAVLGPNLRLEPLCEADRAVLERWREEGSYRGSLIERVFEAGVEEIYRQFGTGPHRFWLVRLLEGAPIGLVTYRIAPDDPSRAEMRKFLADRGQRGRGFGSQMTWLWLHYGFTRLGLRKVTARTVDSNLVNINLNRKLGFRFEGYLRKEVKLRDGFVDVTVMSMLRRQAARLFELPEEASDAPQ